MTAGSDLFISYSQLDGDVAATLLDLLRSAGITCFLAEKSLAPGAEWETELRDAIHRAKHVLVLLTPNSRTSIWVAAEIGAAWIFRKPVIPALRDVPPAQLEGPIGKYQSRQIGTRQEIDALVSEIALLYGEIRPVRSQATSMECFNTADAWDHLLRVGDWAFDTKTRRILGEGMYRYLLSSSVYGRQPYRIDCRLRFESLNPEGRIDAVNAGILFGWTIPGAARRYLSITLSGYSMFVEKIGFNGDDEYYDFEHITEEVPLELRPNEPYEFSVAVDRDELLVSCNGSKLLRASTGEHIVGRVGLRPWRSSVVCEHFEVSTNQNDAIAAMSIRSPAASR